MKRIWKQTIHSLESNDELCLDFRQFLFKSPTFLGGRIFSFFSHIDLSHVPHTEQASLENSETITMPSTMTLSISTLLLLPLGVFATPTVRGIATTRAIETAPFTPGSEPYELCTSHTITSLDLGDNVGSWISCLELQQWAKDNPGKWIINDPADPEYWTALDKWDDCALVVEVSFLGALYFNFIACLQCSLSQLTPLTHSVWLGLSRSHRGLREIPKCIKKETY